MYRRPKFLEVLLDIRQEMAHEADYDTDLFAEMVRSGRRPTSHATHDLSYKDKVSGRRRSAPDRKSAKPQKSKS